MSTSIRFELRTTTDRGDAQPLHTAESIELTTEETEQLLTFYRDFKPHGDDYARSNDIIVSNMSLLIHRAANLIHQQVRA